MTQWLRASKNKTALDSGMLRGTSIHSLFVVLGIAGGLCLLGLRGPGTTQMEPIFGAVKKISGPMKGGPFGISADNVFGGW